MRLLLLDEHRAPVEEPYIVSLLGWTKEQYLRDAPESRFCEFVRGTVIMPSPVRAEHQSRVLFLSWLLSGFCEAHAGEVILTGPAALQVAPDIIREPDIFVLPADQAHRARGVPVTEAVPSLIIEVGSRSTMDIDLVDKAAEYAALGVAEYWAVDGSGRRLHRHLLGADGRYAVDARESGRLDSVAVAGFWIDVDWLWRDPLPPARECLAKIEGG
ncbi:MAG: Uma2 family endonuclease [Planctomycetes bacterium]|nr:Uma2 family endonuclease [Planctomycetota bacterium]